jgi:hypothetical protein
MDYDFFLKFYRRGVRSNKLDIVLSKMRDIGISLKIDWPSLRRRFDEEQQVYYRCIDNVLP